MAATITELRQRSTHVGSDYIRTSKRVFLIVTDNAGYGPLYVKLQLAILGFFPGILSTYVTGGAHSESDFFQQVLDVEVNETDTDGLQWQATVTYGPWNPDTMGESPILLPPALNVEGQIFRKVIDQDINGNPLVNTAGDPYDPGVEIDQERVTIRITQNLQTFPAFAFAYCNYLNSQPFCTLPAKTVKQSAPQVERSYHPACGRYYITHHLFEHNPDPDGWKETRFNVGFRQLVAGVQTQILDPHGLAISSPLPLDASGAVLTPPVNAGDLITNKYDVYQTVDFNSIYSFGSLP